MFRLENDIMNLYQGGKMKIELTKIQVELMIEALEALHKKVNEEGISMERLSKLVILEDEIAKLKMMIEGDLC